MQSIVPKELKGLFKKEGRDKWNFIILTKGRKSEKTISEANREHKVRW